MHRWFGLEDVPAGTGPSVVTLGNFDGVHRGHQAVLRRVVDEARRRDATAVAVTFDPHPLEVLHPDHAPVALAGLGERLDLMAATGLDAVLVQRFTLDLAAWTPDQYVRGVFVRALRAAAVVIGRDVRFGVRNSGDFATLVELGRREGFDVVGLDDLGLAPGEEDRRRWSSTWVREALAAGDVAAAARVLGRAPAVTGTVVHGDARGRELGYPTANLGAEGRTGMVPAEGVYAAWLVAEDGARRPAAVSVGTNPQFGAAELRVEAHVIDETGLDLYGRRVRLEFVERLRGQQVFAGVGDLVDQMGRDVARARHVLRGVAPGDC